MTTPSGMLGLYSRTSWGDRPAACTRDTASDSASPTTWGRLVVTVGAAAGPLETIRTDSEPAGTLVPCCGKLSHDLTARQLVVIVVEYLRRKAGLLQLGECLALGQADDFGHRHERRGRHRGRTAGHHDHNARTRGNRRAEARWRRFGSSQEQAGVQAQPQLLLPAAPPRRRRAPSRRPPRARVCGPPIRPLEPQLPARPSLRAAREPPRESMPRARRADSEPQTRPRRSGRQVRPASSRRSCVWFPSFAQPVWLRASQCHCSPPSAGATACGRSTDASHSGRIPPTGHHARRLRGRLRCSDSGRSERP